MWSSVMLIDIVVYYVYVRHHVKSDNINFIFYLVIKKYTCIYFKWDFPFWIIKGLGL
jgi:hypothetical protein